MLKYNIKNSNCQTVINIWSWAPDGARNQDALTDWSSVVMWLWLWLAVFGEEPAKWVGSAGGPGPDTSCRAYGDYMRWGLDWQVDLLDSDTHTLSYSAHLYYTTALQTILTEYHGRVFTRQGPGPPAHPTHFAGSSPMTATTGTALMASLAITRPRRKHCLDTVEWPAVT
jgi:hypothetical protein